MCEFLIRIREIGDVDPDLSSPVLVAMNDVHRSAQLLHKGDVIVVCRDGWWWSYTERNHPGCFIVKVPGMPVDEGESWATREPSRMERGEVLRQRAFMLNVEKLKPVMTRDELRAATVRKPPLLDQMRM